MKIAAIGQAIMQAARPRVLLAPLQFGLGVQMHHHFASRFLMILCTNMVAVHIMKYSNLNEMLRYHINQISLITQHSLCNMQLIMWTITFELSMVTTLFMVWE